MRMILARRYRLDERVAGKDEIDITLLSEFTAQTRSELAAPAQRIHFELSLPEPIEQRRRIISKILHGLGHVLDSHRCVGLLCNRIGHPSTDGEFIALHVDLNQADAPVHPWLRHKFIYAHDCDADKSMLHPLALAHQAVRV